MAKFDTKALGQLKATWKGQTVEKAGKLLRSFGFEIEASNGNGKLQTFVREDVRISIYTDNNTHISKPMRSEIINACDAIISEAKGKAEENAGKSRPLEQVIQEEADLLNKLKTDYDIEVSIEKKSGTIIFYSKECGIKKIIERKNGVFDLKTSAVNFEAEVGAILEDRMEQLQGIIDITPAGSSEVEDKYVFQFTNEKATVNTFGAGWPTKDSLSGAQAAYKRYLAEPEPEQIVAPKAAAATSEQAKKAATTPEQPRTKKYHDYATHITDGGLTRDAFSAKKRVRAVLDKIYDMPDHNPILNWRLHNDLGMTEQAVLQYFDPEHEGAPSKSAPGALNAMKEKVFKIVKEAQDEGKVPKGTITKFREDLKKVADERTKAKDEQWER